MGSIRAGKQGIATQLQSDILVAKTHNLKSAKGFAYATELPIT